MARITICLSMFSLPGPPTSLPGGWRPCWTKKRWGMTCFGWAPPRALPWSSTADSGAVIGELHDLVRAGQAAGDELAGMRWMFGGESDVFDQIVVVSRERGMAIAPRRAGLPLRLTISKISLFAITSSPRIFYAGCEVGESRKLVAETRSPRVLRYVSRCSRILGPPTSLEAGGPAGHRQEALRRRVADEADTERSGF